MLELFFRDLLIGHIKNFANDDGAWLVGEFELTPDAANMLHFFAYLVDDSDLVEFDGPTDWLDENNWLMRDTETGESKRTSLPAIYADDGSIYWRWSD